MSTPNIFADQVEFMRRHMQDSAHVCLSVHTHNDRGCAVAASELGLLAGADRVEGTLFGNGERTGNADLLTLAMNLYSRGIDPTLNLSDTQRLIETYEECTQLPVHPRHPWVGELVYTAFSGSHQDAIRKSLAYHEKHALPHWEVAYLPIDPADLGRDYEAIVRINSQSGKGGVAHVLERDFNVHLPKWMHAPLAKTVQRAAEHSGTALSSQTICEIFAQHCLDAPEAFTLAEYRLDSCDGQTTGTFELVSEQQSTESTPPLNGTGQGPIEALVQALRNTYEQHVEIQKFEESALGQGTQAQALACVELTLGEKRSQGCAIATDITRAGLQAVLTAFWQVWRQITPAQETPIDSTAPNTHPDCKTQAASA
jgi:2-isopropylmalate synthase